MLGCLDGVRWYFFGKYYRTPGSEQAFCGPIIDSELVNLANFSVGKIAATAILYADLHFDRTLSGVYATVIDYQRDVVLAQALLLVYKLYC